MEPAIRIVAMPKDANPDGDVFGGWIMSMMDVAGAIPARRIAKTRVVTVAIENLHFLLPVFIGDCLECYSTVERIGTTSVTVKVEAMVERRHDGAKFKVTEGRITYVAIDEHRNKIKIER